MIFTFILLLFANMWAFAFQLIPTAHLPSGISSAVSTVLGWMWVANPVFDISTAFLLFKLYISIELGMWAIEFFVWIYSKIPIIGKK